MYRMWVREDVPSVCRRPRWVPWGCVMAEFVRFTLDDGSEVLFESAESDLVALHGGAPECDHLNWPRFGLLSSRISAPPGR